MVELIDFGGVIDYKSRINKAAGLKVLLHAGLGLRKEVVSLALFHCTHELASSAIGGVVNASGRFSLLCSFHGAKSTRCARLSVSGSQAYSGVRAGATVRTMPALRGGSLEPASSVFEREFSRNGPYLHAGGRSIPLVSVLGGNGNDGCIGF